MFLQEQDACSEVSIVVLVGDAPAQRAKLAPLLHYGVQEAQGEQQLTPLGGFYTLQALHTGHDGSATTIHASSAEDALFRFELLARQSMRDLTVVDLRSYIARVFDLVVVLRRLRTGLRVVRQVAALDGLTDGGTYRLTDVFTADLARPGEPRFVRNEAWRPSPRLAARLESEGERWS